MTTDPAAATEAALDQRLAALAATPGVATPGGVARRGAAAAEPDGGAAGAVTVELFVDMVRSRSIDVTARRLKAAGRGYHTIHSAGHELNAIVGALTTPDDLALLHYRSGAFLLARARQVAGVDGVDALVRSLVAAADEPASGGRHKVIGHPRLGILPQTSTIASHLPKAVGAAVFSDRSPAATGDEVVVCSFGDASLHHASALSALNAARYARRLGRPVPLLLVCEDNGLGISVPTPIGWVEQTVAHLPQLRYRRASGAPDAVYATIAEAVAEVRERRRPVFLHLPCVRLWGHAGSDVEPAYRSRDAIAAAAAGDPLLAVAAHLVASGTASGAELVAAVADVRAEVAAASDRALAATPLTSREAVMAPLRLPADPSRTSRVPTADAARRREVHGGTLPEEATAPQRRTLAAHLNAALHDALAADDRTIVFGQDVGAKGGVYGVTAKLQERFGPARVFDTLLDETTILGTAQGAALRGLLPIAEISYLAYLHNAIDQLRGEAASTAFFSAGTVRTPVVVRVGAFAYQRGFGGHFHNDHAVGALLEIPGLVVAAPSRGDDAARLLHGALALARSHGRVVCLLEPIALYHTRDLHGPGDHGWCTDHPSPPTALWPGQVGVHGPGDAEVVVLTFANGVPMSLRAARAADVPARVVDLRWLAPLPWDAIDREVAGARRVVVVDECRASGGIADHVVAGLARRHPGLAVTSVTSADSYVPLGPAADLVLLSETEIGDALRGSG